MKLFDTISAKCMVPSAKNQAPSLLGEGRGGVTKAWSAFLILFFSLFSFSLQSCSDDFEPQFINEEILPDNALQVTIQLPEAETLQSRAVSDDISSINVFLFDQNGTTKLLTQSANSLPSDNKFTFTLNTANQSGTRQIYVLVNGPSAAINATTIDDIEKTVLTDDLNNASPKCVRSGQASVAEGTKQVTVTVNRVIAGVAVVQSTPADCKYTIDRFQLRNIPTKGYVGAGSNSAYHFNTEAFKNFSFTTISSTAAKTYAYTYPVESNKADKNGGAFVIIRANYTENEVSKQTFYRLNFRDKTSKTPIDILPNNLYDVVVEKIEGPGHETIDEAVAYYQGDDEKVTYDIHDHAANVLSMVTDGTNELGMTYDFEWYTKIQEETPRGETPAETTTFTVKCYAKDEPSTNAYSDFPTPELIQGGDWLVLDTTTREDDDENSGEHSGDPDNKGKIMKYTLSLKSNGKYTGEAIIKVTWRGLTRQLKISRSANIDLSGSCNAKLIITYPKTYSDYWNETTVNITDYWTFLAGEGNDENNAEVEDSTPKMDGVGVNSMGYDKNRDEGFHFPLMYGEASSRASYKYEITFDSSKYPGISNAEIIIPEDSEDNDFVLGDFSQSYSSSNGTLTFELSSTGKNNETYKTGDIQILLTTTAGSVYLPYKVYHTGFFHWHKSKKQYLYYEVVPMGDRKWLDRNIGASSCGMYIEDINGNSYLGNDIEYMMMNAAQGDYTEVYYSDDSVLYDDPLEFSGVCPPGFHVPTEKEFDGIRTSSKFIKKSETQGSHTYFTSYYASSNKKIGEIYFPKARYRDKSDKKYGDDNAGYYWTQTVASGLEKQQIGRWLRVLNINGTSASYINGNVTHDGVGHRMSLRCIAGDVDKGVQSTIAFNVKGATHVYLYDKTNGTPLFTFPGKAMTSASGAESWQYFSYKTASDPASLLVLFSYMGTDGKTKVFTQNGNSFTTNTGKNVNELRSYGWTVDDHIGWYFDFSSTAKTPNVTHGNPAYKTYRFYWPKSMNNSQGGYIYAWLAKNLEEIKLNGEFDDNKMVNTSDGNYYYIQFSQPEDKNSYNFKYILKWANGNKLANDDKDAGLLSTFSDGNGAYKDEYGDPIYCKYINTSYGTTAGKP